MDTLGQAIRKARIDQRLQQKALVERTGISQKYLSQIENDRVDPNFGLVQRIAKALKISLDAYLLEERQEGS
jgi:transcriptional regulator with XRE-family HTH domain